MYRIWDLQDFIKELIIMSDYLFPALQKYYSALNSLERFNKEANFFDNISALDSFFSEYPVSFALPWNIPPFVLLPLS